MEEVKRILKDHALFLITTPNLAAWYNRLLLLCGIMPIHYEISLKKKYGRIFRQLGEGSRAVKHIRVFTPCALSKLLQDNGFKILELVGLQFIFDGYISKVLDKVFASTPSLSSMFLILAGKSG